MQGGWSWQVMMMVCTLCSRQGAASEVNATVGDNHQTITWGYGCEWNG